MSPTHPTLPIVVRRRKRWDGEVEWTAIHKRTLTFRLRVWWADVRRPRHLHRPAKEPRLGKTEIQILAFSGTIIVLGSAAWLLLISLAPNRGEEPAARPTVMATSPSVSPTATLLVVPLTPRAEPTVDPEPATSLPVAPRTSVVASSSAADTPTPAATATTQGTPGDATQTSSDVPPREPTTGTPNPCPHPESSPCPPTTPTEGSASPSPTPSDTLLGVVLSLLTLEPTNG